MSITRLPFHSFGTVNLRRYHMHESPFLPMPESSDSGGNGTRILRTPDAKDGGAEAFTGETPEGSVM